MRTILGLLFAASIILGFQTSAEANPPTPEQWEQFKARYQTCTFPDGSTGPVLGFIELNGTARMFTGETWQAPQRAGSAICDRTLLRNRPEHCGPDGGCYAEAARKARLCGNRVAVKQRYDFEDGFGFDTAKAGCEHLATGPRKATAARHKRGMRRYRHE